MNKAPKSKKLKLNAETIRTLTTDELRTVVGASDAGADCGGSGRPHCRPTTQQPEKDR